MVKSNRCNHDECNTKLGMLGFECQCGYKYCSKHRLPEDHMCSFNHKETSRNHLASKLLNEKVVADKIVNKL